MSARLSERVSDGIRWYVDERGLTAADIAESTGIGVRAVRTRLDGLALWSVDEAHAVACMLGVSMVALLGDD